MTDPRLATLGILAGGQARRLGGRDKARLLVAGRLQIERVLDAFPGPFAERLLSYNRDPHGLPAGLRIVPDAHEGFPGPVAALEALATACRTPWLLTVPVDCRTLPEGLAEALFAARERDGALLRDADGLQPLVGAWRADALRPACAALLASGNASAQRLRDHLQLGVLDLSPQRLGNLNTPQDLDA